MRYFGGVGAQCTVILSLLFVGCAAVSHREEIGVLMGVAKDSEHHEKIAQNESRSFKRCKEAILQGKLKVGMHAEDVLDKVGEPVIAERLDEEVKWSYKDGDRDWFDGEVIHLFFGRDNTLIRWACLRFSCESDKTS